MAREKPKPIDVYSLGLSGVLIDPHPLMPETPTDALVQAQNVSHDPTLARGGALRKRPGFTKFNQVNAGGVILGGCPMAVAGTGGAPPHGGGGDTGGDDGGGDGTGGSGGDGGDGGGGGGGTDPGGTGGGAFGGNTGIIVGIDTNNSANGYGFLISPPKGTSAAAVTTSPFAPGMPGNTGFSVGIKGHPSVATDDGWFYFAKAKDQDSTAGLPQLIYRTNGTVTQLVATITEYSGPDNRYPTVTAMCYAISTKKVYFVIRDTLYNVTTGPAPQSRLFELDHTNLTLSTIGILPIPSTVMVMLWSDYTNRLYMFPCSELTGAQWNADLTYGLIMAWWPALGTTIYTTGHFCGQPFIMSACEITSATGSAKNDDGTRVDPWSQYGIRFGGLKKTGTTYFRQVQGYPFDLTTYDGLQAIVAPAVVDSPIAFGQLNLDNSTSELAGHYNASQANADNAGVYSMAFYKGAMYYAWYNPGVKAAIVKESFAYPNAYNFMMGGNYSDSWADTGVGSRMPFELSVINNVLYAFGSDGSLNRVMYTEDGTTWTDISTNFLTNNPAGWLLPTIHWHIDA